MLFIVTLSYARPLDEVNRRLDAHRDWLVAHTAAGRILVAGPLEPRTGGLIVAHCDSRTELDHMMDQDPFVTENLVTVDVRCSAPALRHPEFPVRWATGAKAVAG